MTSLSFLINSNKHFSCNYKYITKSKVDFEILKSNLLLESWAQVYSSTNPSVAFSYFSNILYSHVEMCTTTLRHKKNIKIKPWMSNSLLNMMKKRDKLRLSIKKHPGKIRAENSMQDVKLNVKNCKDSY